MVETFKKPPSEFKEDISAQFTPDEKKYWFAPRNYELPNAILVEAVRWSKAVTNKEILQGLLDSKAIDIKLTNLKPDSPPIEEVITGKLTTLSQTHLSIANNEKASPDIKRQHKTAAFSRLEQLLSFTIATTTLTPDQIVDYLRAIRQEYESLGLNEWTDDTYEFPPEEETILFNEPPDHEESCIQFIQNQYVKLVQLEQRK